MRGTIDRITDSVDATTLMLHPKTKYIATGYRWDLRRIPTKRVFLMRLSDNLTAKFSMKDGEENLTSDLN